MCVYIYILVQFIHFSQCVFFFRFFGIISGRRKIVFFCIYISCHDDVRYQQHIHHHPITNVVDAAATVLVITSQNCNHGLFLCGFVQALVAA